MHILGIMLAAGVVFGAISLAIMWFVNLGSDMRKAVERQRKAIAEIERRDREL